MTNLVLINQESKKLLENNLAKNNKFIGKDDYNKLPNSLKQTLSTDVLHDKDIITKTQIGYEEEIDKLPSSLRKEFNLLEYDGADLSRDEGSYQPLFDKVPLGKTLGFSNAEKTAFRVANKGAGMFYNLIANVPVLAQGLTEGAVQKAQLGLDYEELEESDLLTGRRSTFEQVQYDFYKNLKSVSDHYHRKADERYGVASNLPEMIVEDFAMLPYIIGLYTAPTRFLGMAGGIGVTDAIMSADKGAAEMGKSFVKGLTIGKYLEWAGPLAPISRMTTTGVLGASLPADNVEERVRNAIAFGGLSVIPIPGAYQGQKTAIERGTERFVNNIKYVNAFRKSKKQFEGINKEITFYNKLVEQQEKAIEAGDKALEAQLQGKIDKQTDILRKVASKELRAIDEITQRVLQEKNDTTSPGEKKLQLVEFRELENELVRNSPDMTRDSYLEFAEKYGLPPSLALKRFPVVKYTTDLANNHRIKNENMILEIINDPVFVDYRNPRKLEYGLTYTVVSRTTVQGKDGRTEIKEDLFTAKSREEAQKYRDDLVKKAKTGEAFEIRDNVGWSVPLGRGTAMRLTKSTPGENGMFYEFNRLTLEQQIKLKDVAFQIEKDGVRYKTISRGTMEVISQEGPNVGKMTTRSVVDILNDKNTGPQTRFEAEKKAVFDPNTGEVFDAALKDTYGFNDGQVAAYRQIRNGIEQVRTHYNKQVKRYGFGFIEKIEYIPNYLPHMFYGNFRVFVSVPRITSKGKKGKRYKLIKAVPADKLKQAKRIEEELRKEFPDAKINIRKINKDKKNYKGQDLSFSYFAEALMGVKDNSFAAQAIQRTYLDVMSKRELGKFGATKLKRRQDQVEGFRGSAEGKQGVKDFVEALSTYVEGGIKAGNRIELRHQLNEFFNTPIVRGKQKVFKTETDSGLKYKKNLTIQDLYPYSAQFSQKFIDSVLGTERSVITEKVRQAVEKVTKDNFTERQIADTFANLNQFTLTTKLLALNARFLLAQGIQPYQMIIPKLVSLNEKAGGGFLNPYEAVVKATKSLINPSAKDIAVIKEAMRNQVINEKFINEFAGEFVYQQRGRKQFLQQLKKGEYVGVGKKVLHALTGREVSGRVEQFSRLNATLMFSHILRKAGLTEKEVVKNSWYLADNYMVRYDAFDRALLFGESGLGILGRPIGLFKTFQQNFYAQFVEHVRDASKYGQVNGLATFVASNVIFAGTLGILGINTVDSLLYALNSIPGVNIPIPYMSEILMDLGMGDFFLFGAPSALTGVDMQSTLGAPGIGLSNIFVPVTLGIVKDTITPFESDSILSVSTRALLSQFSDKILPPTREDVRDSLKVLAPLSIHGLIEQFFQKQGDTKYMDNNKKRLDRDLSDWFARYLSSYSIEESKYIKLRYITSRMDRRATANFSNLLDSAVSTYYHTGNLSGFYLDYAEDLGYTQEQFITAFKRRMKSRDRSLLDDLKRGKLNDKKMQMIELFNKNIKEREMGNEAKGFIIPDRMKDALLY